MVKTHRIMKGDDAKGTKCSCGEVAHYWSQNEDGDKPLGPVIFHCQRRPCRSSARAQASRGRKRKTRGLKGLLGL